MLKTLNADVAIIGVGTAGMTAYRAARAHTERVVTIESGFYGTTCARVGCMPSKLLIAAAEAAHRARRAPIFGVYPGEIRVDGEKVMRRIREERDRFVGFVVDSVESWPDEHRVHGHARFVGPNTLMVDDHTRIEAQRIVIATGSSPVVPEGWRQALGKRLVVNDDIFDWQTLPESVVVIGAGVIGLELAQALARLGVRVRLLNRSERVGPLTDPEVAAKAREIVEQTVPTVFRANIGDVEQLDDGVAIQYEADGQVCRETFEFLLSATGRRPNLGSLDLSAAGIVLDGKGLPKFNAATGQIENLPVFIAGDASHAHPILHEAADDGRIAGDNAGRFPDILARPRRAPLNVVFSDPQIMIAGMSYADVSASGGEFGVGVVSFEDQGRSRVMDSNAGLLRVYGEVRSGRFLGAEMIGPAAEHLGHLLSWSAQHRLTVQQMLDSAFYHPVVEEGLRTALQVLKRDLRR